MGFHPGLQYNVEQTKGREGSESLHCNSNQQFRASVDTASHKRLLSRQHAPTTLPLQEEIPIQPEQAAFLLGQILAVCGVCKPRPPVLKPHRLPSFLVPPPTPASLP